VSVVVVMPSRGRPSRAHAAIAAIRGTAARVDTRVVLAVDEDDPELEAYRALRWETGDLVRATNTVAMRIATEDPGCVIGNLGDDHVARTPAWDRRVLEALDEPGIAYGDDRFQRRELPTAPFISASIVLALGWYALPACRHLFVDNAWRDLGVQAGCLRYLPDVVIEHVHPLAGKAAWDEGYHRANGEETVEHDKRAYDEWREASMGADVDRVRAAIPVAA
jgi:hypothetical protein